MNLSFGFEAEVEIVRTSRRQKSVSFKIKNGKVIVTAPSRLSDKIIGDMINKRSAWVKKQLHILSKRPVAPPKQYVNGEGFLYLGKSYKLQLVEGDSIGVALDGNYLTVSPNSTVPASKSKQHIKDLLTAWFLGKAKENLETKTNEYAELLGFMPKSIIVKTYKARWGSCSTKGDISYNWKLIMSPQHIIDYVVVHELCHMKQHNHSPRFWKLVENIIPDHKARRKWLGDNGEQLSL
ncbi:MAG: M48 family metallopeptidase [Sphingomonadales bacterium]|nr:M48 family metallopeptidase [Sphingomonadales bacterium]